ncbi:MAG: TolC family protein [Candidatus Accumulibacter sp.]|jgi:outer membrane protein TolC|nr:TolC family protein [Accumulibacter sp.]
MKSFSRNGIFFLAFASFLLSFHATAEIRPPQPYTLAELSAMLNAENPRILQLRQEQKAAEAVVPQMLAFDNPEFGFTHSPIRNHPFRAGAARGVSYTLKQSFSFPGKKRLAADIAQNQADFIGTEAESLKQELLAELKTGFWTLLSLQREVRVSEENLARLEQIKQISKIQYANNATAYVDYLNAQVAQSSAQNELFSLRRRIDTTAQNLNRIVGRDPGSPLEVRGEIPALREKIPEREYFTGIALKNSPKIRGSALLTNAAEKGVEYAKKSYLPDFEIAVTKTSDNPPWGMSGNEYATEFNFILPTWGFFKERAAVDQARASLIASRANEQAVRQQILLDLAAHYNLLLQTREQIRLLRTRQLEQAQVAWRLARQNYSTNNGGRGFTELLLAQTNLRSTELALLQAESSAAQAWSGMESVIGLSIE